MLYKTHRKHPPAVSHSLLLAFAICIVMSVQKVALITAGSAGLGAQVARALAPDFRVVSEHSIL